VNWHLELSHRPLFAVQLLDGEPVQVAAWVSTRKVHFYAAENGAFYGDLSVAEPANRDMQSEAWRAFLETLRAPNGAYLPVVDTGQRVIHTSADGRLRVYREPDDRLLLDVDGRQTALVREGNAPLVAVGLDRDLGTLGALSADGLLHIYQQHVYVGAFAVEVQLDGAIPKVLLPGATGTVVVIDTAAIQTMDMGGQVQRRLAAPAAVESVACSPDGSQIVVGDREQGIMRLYDVELTLMRQRATLDVLARTAQLQLFDALLPPDGTPETVDVANDGTLAFALTGILCLTHIDELTALPQPRAFF
jgi:hypothetical protein